ncbi:hypothetical protein LCGC14_0533530 [marine sediment metagenome]|uniref:Uncharacterized protein n=1 Tax=marine sediment metagenome TaxID=412755 RepID=A0A0F9V367_9ZZZZ
MTYPREYQSTHDWELDSPSIVDLANIIDQASQGNVKEKPRYEWYICKKCHAKSTKWLDDTFPELKNKFVYNPSGGIGFNQMYTDTSCELAEKYLKFCESGC